MLAQVKPCDHVLTAQLQEVRYLAQVDVECGLWPSGIPRRRAPSPIVFLHGYLAPDLAGEDGADEDLDALLAALTSARASLRE